MHSLCVAGPALDDLEHAEEGKFTATALYKQIQGESKLQRREAGDLPHHSHDYGKAHFADVGHDEHTATPGTLICRAVACLATLITAQPTLTSPPLLYALHELSGVDCQRDVEPTIAPSY